MFLNFNNAKVISKIEYLLIGAFLLSFFGYSMNELVIDYLGEYSFPILVGVILSYLIFTRYNRIFLISFLYAIGLFLNDKFPMLSGEHNYIINLTYMFYLFNCLFDDEIFFQMNIVYVGLLYQVSFIRHIMDNNWLIGKGLFNFLNNPLYSSKSVEYDFFIIIANYLILIFELVYLGLLFTRFNRVVIGFAIFLNVCCLYFLDNYLYYLFLLFFNFLLYSEEDF